jgi:hypothetical protein
MEKIIWTNDFSLSDWKSLEEEYSEADETEINNLMSEISDEAYNMTKANLNISISILVIADLGLWNGRRQAYKELNNLKSCFEDNSDYLTWFVEDGEFRCRAHHHDGTNYYVYRTWRSGISDIQKERLLFQIYNQEAKQVDIDFLTKKLGNYVCKRLGL